VKVDARERFFRSVPDGEVAAMSVCRSVSFDLEMIDINSQKRKAGKGRGK
jgi:hypothetical protein